MKRAAVATLVRRARDSICSMRSRIRPRFGNPVKGSCRAWKRIWSTKRALLIAMEAWAASPLSLSARRGVTTRRSGSIVTPATM